MPAVPDPSPPLKQLDFAPQAPPAEGCPSGSCTPKFLGGLPAPAPLFPLLSRQHSAGSLEAGTLRGLAADYESATPSLSGSPVPGRAHARASAFDCALLSASHICRAQRHITCCAALSGPAARCPACQLFGFQLMLTSGSLKIVVANAADSSNLQARL